jgi:hypothetical protein
MASGQPDRRCQRRLQPSGPEPVVTLWPSPLPTGHSVSSYLRSDSPVGRPISTEGTECRSAEEAVVPTTVGAEEVDPRRAEVAEADPTPEAEPTPPALGPTLPALAAEAEATDQRWRCRLPRRWPRRPSHRKAPQPLAFDGTQTRVAPWSISFRRSNNVANDAIRTTWACPWHNLCGSYALPATSPQRCHGPVAVFWRPTSALPCKKRVCAEPDAHSDLNHKMRERN